MKVTFNIQKKHLIFLIALSIIISIGIVFGTSYPADNPPSHNDLWTQNIYGKGVTTINVKDNFNLNDKSINAFGVASQNVVVFGTLSAHFVYLWDDDADGFIDKAYGGNDCNDDNPDVYSDIKDQNGKIITLNPNVGGECSNSVDYNCDGKLTYSDRITLCGSQTIKQSSSPPKIVGGGGGSPLIMKEIYVGATPQTPINRWWEGIGYQECQCPSGTSFGTICIYSTTNSPC